MEKLKIRTEQLKPAGRIEQTVPLYRCEAIEDYVRQQELNIDFSLTLTGGHILLRGEIKGTVSVECCRCLDVYTYPVRIPLEQVYPASLDEIDIEDEVRQLLLLHLPSKPLCKPECAGICPQCGQNRNKAKCTCKAGPADPRWEKLKDFMKK